MFTDRKDAGRRLALALSIYRNEHGVVIALPRGGVVLGRIVADALALPLDIAIARKIGHPHSPEYAIGVIDEAGSGIWNQAEVAAIDPVWLQEEIEKQQHEALRRRLVYRGDKEPLALKGKVVIIVDDGVATGLTMQLAVRSAKLQGAEKIVVAVPVAPSEAVTLLKHEGADELFVLEPPTKFTGSVGTHYKNFPQMTDGEVVHLLHTDIT